MRMLVIMYGGPRAHLVPALLNQNQVQGWTRLAEAHGAGAGGRREGSRAWPGESQVFFTVVEDEMVERLTTSLRARAAEAEPGERIHVATLPVERFF